MPGLKRHNPDFAFDGNRVTPDEIDQYVQYTVINPSIDSQWFGTAVGTSTQGTTLGLINSIADYPRNLKYIISTVSGSTGGGTFTATGFDQFGSAVQEVAGFAAAANGGTVIGTQVFAKMGTISAQLATMNAGNGTMAVGVGTAGTTTIFGLPVRLGATSDIKTITGSFNGVGTSTAGTFVFGGTPSSAAQTTMHGFKAPLNVPAGTCVYNVLVRPTFTNTLGVQSTKLVTA